MLKTIFLFLILSIYCKCNNFLIKQNIYLKKHFIKLFIACRIIFKKFKKKFNEIGLSLCNLKDVCRYLWVE